MKKSALVLALAWGAALSFVGSAQQPSEDGPRYRNATSLIRPVDYREWTFLSSGLGMTYEDSSASQRPQQAAPPTFGNVFVNPSSYRSFMQTGKWPDKTIFILEVRTSGSDASINKAGRFQTGLAALEAEVKDSRFPDGWAFFNFGPARSMKDVAEPLSGQAAAPCVDCHTKHTAAERTFVQFYPTLLEAARQKGTLKAGF